MGGPQERGVSDHESTRVRGAGRFEGTSAASVARRLRIDLPWRRSPECDRARAVDCRERGRRRPRQNRRTAGDGGAAAGRATVRRGPRTRSSSASTSSPPGRRWRARRSRSSSRAAGAPAAPAGRTRRDDLFPLCPCGSADVEVTAGRQLKIMSVEVALTMCATCGCWTRRGPDRLASPTTTHDHATTATPTSTATTSTSTPHDRARPTRSSSSSRCWRKNDRWPSATAAGWTPARRSRST